MKLIKKAPYDESMTNEEVKDEIFRLIFCEQKKIVATAITRAMTQKEEKSKLLSKNKVATFEEDFLQPEKGLVTIESLEEIREAQRKDPYIAKLGMNPEWPLTLNALKV
uniref:Uncharacterized protein n=1 Tax=Romanomermis culicivorax TaxID=13658 RepID=A0A915K9Z1_ROMCU